MCWVDLKHKPKVLTCPVQPVKGVLDHYSWSIQILICRSTGVVSKYVSDLTPSDATPGRCGCWSPDSQFLSYQEKLLAVWALLILPGDLSSRPQRWVVTKSAHVTFNGSSMAKCLPEKSMRDICLSKHRWRYQAVSTLTSHRPVTFTSFIISSAHLVASMKVIF